MKIWPRRLRKLVTRAHGSHYLLLTLISFAGAVILTRLFLILTGYPQVGNRELHFAHVLWGGLLLFISAAALLSFSNHSIYRLGAVGAGVGAGLFMDEVGKFITATNNYFYPLAFPLIYGFFLLVVLAYLEVRRYQPRDARTELYNAFDTLQEVLDNDLEPLEREALMKRLLSVKQQAERPDLAALAQVLLTFLDSETLALVQEQDPFWKPWKDKWYAFEAHWLTPFRYRVILVSGLLLTGLSTSIDSLRTLLVILTPGAAQQALIDKLVVDKVITSPNELAWFTALLAMVGFLNLALLLGAGFLVFGRERPAIRIVYFSLLIALTGVDLLVFYFNQFGAVLDVFVQSGLLMLAARYRQRFLRPSRRAALVVEPQVTALPNTGGR